MACGYQNPTVDMTHKVCTYILNHPPEGGEQVAKNYAKKKQQQEEGEDESPTELLDEDMETIQGTTIQQSTYMASGNNV